MYNGLTQADRRTRLEGKTVFRPLDSSATELLHRLIRIAESVRYHDEEGKARGHMDQLLVSLKTLLATGEAENPPYNGDFEPAQALLYATVRTLSRTLDRFNARWEDFPDWYIDQILRVATGRPRAEKVHVAFVKGRTGKLLIPAGTLVTSSQHKGGNRVHFQTIGDLQLNDVSLGRIIKAHLSREANVYPADVLGAPTAVMVADISYRTAEFLRSPTNEKTREVKQPIGLQIVSPALLLREGRRHVDVTFESELGSGDFDAWLFQTLTANIPNPLDKERYFAGIDRRKVFSHVFYLETSTSVGWSPIAHYTFDWESGRLAFTIKYDLGEQFPETCPCSMDVHGQETAFPVLRLLLNRDAWLYPLIWLEKFYLAKISITTRVEEITDLKIYNELGKVDSSAPFSPFGINGERGAWFAIGNYEMASKNTTSIGLAISWQPLPTDETGLAGYYRHYPAKIDNASFRLAARYLTDSKWKPVQSEEPLSLFMTDDGYGGQDLRAVGPVSEETIWPFIPIDPMSRYTGDEVEYEYGIRAKQGFVSFVLDTPDMGLGQKTYRTLFTEHIILAALKKKRRSAINPPIAPVVQRMTLSYTASDEISLTLGQSNDGSSVHHIYPLGVRQIFPRSGTVRYPFVYSLPSDFNLMFELRHVQLDDEFQFHVAFIPQKRDIRVDDLPEVVWYWGDGYAWEPLPAGIITSNTTRNFMVDGLVCLRFHELPSEADHVWMCASVTKNPASIPSLRQVVQCAVQVEREGVSVSEVLPPEYVLDEVRVPGVASVRQIGAFWGRIEEESPFEKRVRVSEYVAHRGKAVTQRDFERLVLQHFPAVRQVTCLPGFSTSEASGLRREAGSVTLVVFPQSTGLAGQTYPFCPPDLLLDIRRFLLPRVSAYVKQVEVVNPVYEEIIVRAHITYAAGVDEVLAQDRILHQINQLIAPWSHTGEAPRLGYSFAMEELHAAVGLATQVVDVSLRVYQLIQFGTDDFRLRRYVTMDERVFASMPHGVLFPAKRHVLGTRPEDVFGIEEMSIDQNFVIYGEEE